MTCPSCKQKCDTERSVIHKGQLLRGCENCLEEDLSKPNPLSAQHNREAQKTKFRKELLQKNQTDYYKVYKDQAKNLSDELRRQVS